METHILPFRSKVDATLHDTAPMAVRSYFHTVSRHGIVHELFVMSLEMREATLDDVISIEILNELNNARPQRLDHQLHLRRGSQTLNHLLDSTSPMHVFCDSYKIRGNLLDDEELLLLVTMFHQLLAQIIAKRVWTRLTMCNKLLRKLTSHELYNVLINLVIDNVYKIRTFGRVL